MINWIELKDVSTLEKIKDDSEQRKAVLFKHSTRCGISRSALKNFEADAAQLNTAGFDFYYLDLLNFREISNEIAATFEVMHQSPQMLLIRNRKCELHLSHENIDILKLSEYGN